LFLLLPDMSPSCMSVVSGMTQIFGDERITIATQPMGVTQGHLTQTTMASAREAFLPADEIRNAVSGVAGARGQRWKWFAVVLVILVLGAGVLWSALPRHSLDNTISPAGVNNGRPGASDKGAAPPVGPSREGSKAAISGPAVVEDRAPTTPPTTLRPGPPIRDDQSRRAAQTVTGSATPRLALSVTRRPTQRPGGSGDLERIEGILEGPESAVSGLCVAAYARTTGRIWYVQPEVGPGVCSEVSSDRSWYVETRGGAMYVVLLLKSGDSTPPSFRDLAEVQGVLASALIDFK
jgi:hypothetical protein